MAKKLLERGNSLPFEKQNHCKLSLTDIQDIRERYENGEKMTHIHLDYPQVSLPAIRYWVKEENRLEDIERRKDRPSYTEERDKREKEYYKDYFQRRKEAGLKINNYKYTGRINNTTPLSNEQEYEIIKLFESGKSVNTIASEMGLKRTKIQSYFDNINPIWYRDVINRKKIDRIVRNSKVLSLYFKGNSIKEISKQTNIPKTTVMGIIYRNQ